MTAYDSLSSTYKTLSHNNSTKGSAWYVCGPTVYDSAHLGHGRTYVLLDILRRVALHVHNKSGMPRPLYVMNVTDVDDKIIQRSRETVEDSTDRHADPIALARHYEHEFWQDMDHLNVLRPDIICRVSEHVESTIVPYIQQILDGDMAYVMPEDSSDNIGSVYFDVRAFEKKSNGRTKYGKLAPDVASTDFFSWDNDFDYTANEGGQAQQLLRKKRDPRDFALWKYRPRQPTTTSTIIEPESVSYSSPWGPGRPGWHVECSAMIEHLSKEFSSTHQFMAHAGGVDLKFPHHSNEIAQAEAFDLARGATNSQHKYDEWIPHWIHTGHLYVKGRKMSKSLKNFVTIREMLGVSKTEQSSQSHSKEDDEWSSPGDDFRLWCLGLSGSYRGPATYSKDRMGEARVIRESWIRFLIEGQKCLDAKADKDSQTTRYWGAKDNELFQVVTDTSIKCHNALVGHLLSGGGKASRDLDGTTYMKGITSIIEEGMKYLEHANANPNSCPAEPLNFTLTTVRELLGLVGFSDKTCNAGKERHMPGQLGVASTNTAKNHALIDEIVAFRTAIRSSAISGIRNNDGTEAIKNILRICDAFRDQVMPSMGIEILDGKTQGDSGAAGSWRSCAPKEHTADEK